MARKNNFDQAGPADQAAKLEVASSRSIAVMCLTPWPSARRGSAFGACSNRGNAASLSLPPTGTAFRPWTTRQIPRSLWGKPRLSPKTVHCAAAHFRKSL